MNELIASAALVAVGIIAWGVIRYLKREETAYPQSGDVIAFPSKKHEAEVEDALVVERPPF